MFLRVGNHVINTSRIEIVEIKPRGERVRLHHV
jgi:hypothetical protein